MPSKVGCFTAFKSRARNCGTSCKNKLDMNGDGNLDFDDIKLLGANAANLLHQAKNTTDTMLLELKEHIQMIRTGLAMLRSFSVLPEQAISAIDAVYEILSGFEKYYAHWNDLTAPIAMITEPTNGSEFQVTMNKIDHANERAKHLLTHLDNIGVNMPVKPEQLDQVNDAIDKIKGIGGIIEWGVDAFGARNRMAIA